MNRTCLDNAELEARLTALESLLLDDRALAGARAMSTVVRKIQLPALLLMLLAAPTVAQDYES